MRFGLFLPKMLSKYLKKFTLGNDFDAMSNRQEDAIASLKIQVDQLSKQLKATSSYTLRSSFEARSYGDVPLANIECPVCAWSIEHPEQHVKISADFWHTGTIKRIECIHCGLIFGPWSLIHSSPARLSSDYELLYSTYTEGATTEYQKQAFLALAPEKNKSYLNFACGTWATGCGELIEQGWNVFGYEPNLPYQHPRIVRLIGELASTQFDGIFTHNYIEHIQNPVEQFKKWNAMLKLGDRMVHSSPCFEWMYDFSNFHLFFFLGKSVEVLAAKTGFEVVAQIDYEPGNAGLFTRVVTFKKIFDC